MAIRYKRNCNICGEYYIGRGTKYCSQKCYKKREYTDETRVKISVALTGIKRGPPSVDHRRKNSEAKKGKNHPFWGKKGILCHNFGKKHSLEERVRRSERQSGDKGSNWQGGINPINEGLRKGIKYKLWREKVFKRDNYTCTMCPNPVRGGKLHADHIKPFAFYPDLRFDVSNGRTLCVPCHKKTETYAGKIRSWAKKNGF